MIHASLSAHTFDSVLICAAHADNTQIYNPITNTWTRGPEPLVKSGAGMATILNDTVYYCGGLRNGNEVLGPVIADCA